MIVLEPYIFKGFYQYDPDTGSRVRPYEWGSNHFGFNAKEFPLKKPPNTFRIVIMGDSFNWMGLQDWNYTVFLEKKFKQYYGDDRVEVINTGYPGTHTGEELAILKKYALQYHPDLVFLGFFAGNDFYDANPHRKRIVINDLYVDIDPQHEIIFLGYPLVLKSRVFCFFQQKFKIWWELMKARSGSGKTGTFAEDTFFKIERDYLQFCNLRLQKQGRWDENINYIFRSLDEMDSLLKERQIKFAVGIYPDVFQVDSEILKQVMAKYNLKPEDYDSELMQKLLKEYLAKKGIYCVDLLDSFKKVEKNKTIYRYRDIHWNEAGNALAADLLFPELLKYVTFPH